MKFLSPILALLALSLVGCSTYSARMHSAKDLSQFKTVFVINNLDDNHHLDLLLAQSLKARGFDVQVGPPTMMTPNTIDATVTYQDHWGWDFSEHLTALNIEIRDARNKHLLGNAYFTGPASMRTQASEVVERLVSELVKANKSKQAR